MSPVHNRTGGYHEKLLTSVASLVLVTTAFAADPGPADLRATALEMFVKPPPSTTPAVANNPITPDKIALGKALFFDPRISASGVFSLQLVPQSGDRR